MNSVSNLCCSSLSTLSDQYKATALLRAAQGPHADVVAALLGAGADGTMADDTDSTPLVHTLGSLLLTP